MHSALNVIHRHSGHGPWTLFQISSHLDDYEVQCHSALLYIHADTGYKDDFSTLVKWWDIAGTPELFPNYSTLA